MEWQIHLPEQESAAALSLDWTREFLSRFDCSQIQTLRIERSRRRKGGVCGKCFFPTKLNPKYRLLCQVPGPFPCEILIRRSPLYRNADGSWPRVPAGCARGTHFIDRRTGREWIRVYGKTALRDVNEGIVWIVAHEAFHYLRRTRQVPGRNTEIDADRFADEQLLAYQKQVSPPVTPLTLGSATLRGLRRVMGL